MHILLFPVGFILWYLAYEAKPIINDEVTLQWEEKYINKRNKLIVINRLNKSQILQMVNLVSISNDINDLKDNLKWENSKSFHQNI